MKYHLLHNMDLLKKEMTKYLCQKYMQDIPNSENKKWSRKIQALIEAKYGIYLETPTSRLEKYDEPLTLLISFKKKWWQMT